MEAQCNFCEFLGVAPHCGNCTIKKRKIIKGETRAPREIPETLEELVDKITRGENIDIAIGDWKEIELISGQKVAMYVIGRDCDNLENGDSADFTFGIFSFPYIQARMNKDNTNSGSWEHSDMRFETMPLVSCLLPKILHDHISPVVKLTYTNSSTDNHDLSETVDSLWLFSETEINQVKYSKGSQEGAPYPFFNRRNLGLFDGYFYTWLRSSGSGSGYLFCYVRSSGDSYCSNAYYAYGVSFGFCLTSENPQIGDSEESPEN